MKKRKPSLAVENRYPGQTSNGNEGIVFSIVQQGILPIIPARFAHVVCLEYITSCCFDWASTVMVTFQLYPALQPRHGHPYVFKVLLTNSVAFAISSYGHRTRGQTYRSSLIYTAPFPDYYPLPQIRHVGRSATSIPIPTLRVQMGQQRTRRFGHGHLGRQHRSSRSESLFESMDGDIRVYTAEK